MFERLGRTEGPLRVEAPVHRDERGFFLETFRRSELEAGGLPGDFRQDNHSHSARRGTLRGLHYQMAPYAQGKLFRCLRGQVWDVAVDIRRGSPTYGAWDAATLTEGTGTMLWIPPGFAHGFCALTDGAEVAYKTTAEYSPKHERSIRWNDPTLGIPWPVKEPILSPRDAAAPLLGQAENNFSWKP